MPLPSMSHDEVEADQLAPRSSMGLTIAQLSARLRSAECGGIESYISREAVEAAVDWSVLEREPVNNVLPRAQR